MKRRTLRSISSSRLRSTEPDTWLRRPISAYSGLKRIPGLPARRLAATVSLSLPRQETMPRPVITTRRMRKCPSEAVGRGEQADAEAFGAVDFATIDGHAAIGDAEDQRTADGTFDMDVVGEFLRARQHLAEELHFAGTQRTATARIALPAEVEADQLPHGVEAQAARHHRVALEVAGEEPEVRIDIEFGDDLALAVFTAGVADMHDAIDHQHVGGGQLRITRAKQFAAAAGEQFFPGIGVLLGHANSSMVPLWRG